MSGPLQDQIDDAMSALQDFRQKMQATQEGLRSSTESATAKDRSITVVIGAQGELREIKFHTDSYRDLPPQELATLLVELTGTARARMGERVGTAFGGLTDLRDLMRQSLSGGSEFDPVLAAMRAMRPGRPGGAPMREDEDG